MNWIIRLCNNISIFIITFQLDSIAIFIVLCVQLNSLFFFLYLVIRSENKDGQGSYVKCRSVDQRELELSAYPSKERVSPVGIGSRIQVTRKWIRRCHSATERWKVMEDFADDNPIRRFLKTSFTYGNTLRENNPAQNTLLRNCTFVKLSIFMKMILLHEI